VLFRSTFVTVLADGQQRDVTVTTGMTTDGLTQVTPVESGSLKVGDKVVIG
jgi:hypothetical protein